MDYQTVRKLAFRFLSVRAYHSAPLLRKLEERGASRMLAEQVVEECRRLSLLNDDEAILSEFRRGRAPRAIAFKLGISLEEIGAVITRQMQREKLSELKGKLGERNKAIRMLQRKGFDFDLIVEAFSC